MYDEDDAAYDAWMERAREGAVQDSAELDEEHEQRNTPVYSTTLHRGGFGGYESLIVSAYAEQRMVVVTMPPSIVTVDGIAGGVVPGVVRSIPCPRDLPIEYRFAATVTSYQNQGWTQA